MKTNNKKVEDKFYGKRIVKGIFAKVNISSQINAAKQLGVQMARENKSSEYGDSRWNTLLNETYKMVGGENTDQGSNVSKQLREAWKSANEKEQGRIKKIQQDASFKLEAVVRSLKSKLESKGFCSNNKNCSPQDKALQQEIGEAFSYETSDQQFISLIRKMTARLGQPFGAASKNRRRGVKAIFAATKEQTINEIRGLKILIQTYENQLKTHKNLLKSALKYLKTLGEGEETFFRTGSKAKFANGGTKTASFLAKIDSKSKSMILENIAKNYGISAQAALAEVTDSEAENLLDYMTEPARSAASVLMKKYGSFSRTGSKAKFAKEYILWAVPKGKTDTMYSQPIAEQLYTDAQINEVKRKATAAGWHTFRIAEMMSFEDMTNVWKGKPVKRRSSRTGVKAFK